jgi:hypothetical protein
VKHVAAALALAVAAAVGLAAPPARADDVAAYEVEGQADAAGADPRIAALDDAFAHAVQQAVDDLVPDAARKTRKADLDREIVGRARLWVVKFSVTKDATEDGRRQLAVNVRVDRDKLRGRLAELGLAGPAVLDGSGAGDPTAPTPPDAHPAGGRSVLVLVRVTRGGGVIAADYGAGGTPGAPGVAALTAAMRDAGLVIQRAPTSGAAARADGDLPLDDAEADALATAAGADLALVAGVSVGPRQLVRGLPGDAALVTAHVRLVERGTGSRATAGGGSGASGAAGPPGDDDDAIARALAAAAADLLPAPPHPVRNAPQFHGDETPIGEAGVVLVRLPPTTPFAMVEAEAKYLAGAKGVRAAAIRRLSPSGWTLGVTTSETVERIAQLAKKPPASDTDVAVKLVGDVIELRLSGAP